MARYSYMIPRNTKGEGKILMIFSRKSFIWSIAFAGVGLLTIYPICSLFNATLVGMAIVLILGLIGFVISTFKIPNSQNFDICRKTGGEDIDEILIRLLKFKKNGKKVYLYYTGGNENG